MASFKLGMALERWLTGQGKFVGSTVSTKETVPGNGDFQITEWVVAGVAQPNATAIATIISDHEAAEIAEASAQVTDLAAAKTALGLTDAQYKAINKDIATS